jgi:hypothetical protein
MENQKSQLKRGSILRLGTSDWGTKLYGKVTSVRDGRVNFTIWEIRDEKIGGGVMSEKSALTRLSR